MLKRLEEAGLVKREVCKDRRAKLVSLTDEAKARFPLWNREIQEYRKELFAGFSAEDMTLLSQLTDRLLANVKKSN